MKIGFSWSNTEPDTAPSWNWVGYNSVISRETSG